MNNRKQKEYNLAYRRRRSASRLIDKLGAIIEQSNIKDARKLCDRINNELFMPAAMKTDFWGDPPGLDESIEDAEEREVRLRNEILGKTVGRYICPTCHKPGYLFCSNFDAEADSWSLFILHLNWPLADSDYCAISRNKPFFIESVPARGILTISKPYRRDKEMKA